MEDKQRTDTLDKKVTEMFRAIAVEKFGFDPVPNYKNRWFYEKLTRCRNAVLKTGASFETIEKAVDNVLKNVKDGKLPIPHVWETEVRNIVTLEKSQNNKVDEDDEVGRQLRMNRNALIEEWDSKIGVDNRIKLENMYCQRMGYAELVWPVFRLDFWGRLYLKDPDAVATIKEYEQQSKRERHTECDT